LQSLAERLPTNAAGARAVPIQRVGGTHLAAPQDDLLAIEEPLEIRLGFTDQGRRRHANVAVTMRTPGSDEELAVGFLFTEGLIHDAADVAHVGPCARGGANVVRVDLQPGVAIDLARLERHSYMSSSCGVCGKTSLEAVQVCRRPRLRLGQPVVQPAVIHQLPDALRAAQAVFERTGGLHAAALFDSEGSLLCLREDVGRHNALDKLIGVQVLDGSVPLSDRLLFLSGRVSFELVQKALTAGIPIAAAVGAPSSLAIELARDNGMTVLGFVRGNRFNVYCGAERLRAAAWAVG